MDRNDFNLDNSFLLKSFDSTTKQKCMASCNQISQCVFVIFQQNKCFVCKKKLINFMSYKPDGDCLIYQRNFFKPTRGSINYWSFNQNVNDVIGNANLYDGINASFTFDRFDIPNSALSLTNGYYKVPDGVYFSGVEFSILAWVKVRNMQEHSRLIDFGFNDQNEEVVLSLSFQWTGCPYLYFQSGVNVMSAYSNETFILNKWQHLAGIFSYPTYSIYIDGIETTLSIYQTASSFSLANVIRNYNFIGRSSWNGDEDADADFDDLKIFNRALSLKDIQFEMNNNL